MTKLEFAAAEHHLAMAAQGNQETCPIRGADSKVLSEESRPNHLVAMDLLFH